MRMGNTRLAKTILAALLAGVVLSCIVVGVLVFSSDGLNQAEQRGSAYGVTTADDDSSRARG